MVLNEGALVEGGTTLVEFRTALEGSEPASAPRTYLAGVIVTVHPTDVCQWGVVFNETALEVSVSRHTSLIPWKTELTLQIVSDPSWHYEVDCPGSSQIIRFPHGSVERSLSGWLGLILPPGRAGPNGFIIEIPVHNGSPSCLNNRGVEYGSNEFGNVRITVDVVTPPCSPPLPMGAP